MQPVGAFVAFVRELGRVPGRRGAGRLDLRPLVPLVVARDRHAVRLRVDRCPPHRVVGLAAAAKLDSLVAGRAHRVVARADRRQAEQLELVRRLAEPVEGARAAVDDVVRVDAVEMGRGCVSDQGRLGEELDTVEAVAERRPVGIGDVERVVDEEPPDPELLQVLEVRLHREDVAAGVRLEMGGNADVRAPGRRDHEREPPVLRGAPAPPRGDDLLDPGARDLLHLGQNNARVRARVEPSGGVVVGGVRGRIRARPVHPAPVSGRRPVPGVVEDRDVRDRDRRSAGRRLCGRENGT